MDLARKRFSKWMAAWLGLCVLGQVWAGEVSRAGLVSDRDGRWLAPDIGRIVQRGALIVAVKRGDDAPFFYTDPRTGQPAGISIQIAQELARELKVKLIIKQTASTFNETVDLVTRGEADLGVSKLSRTLSRLQVVRFSEPYVEFNHALLLNRVKFAQLARGEDASSVIRSFKAKMGVIGQSAFADFASHHFPDAQLVAYPDWEALIEAVTRGEVVAAYRDQFEINRVLAQHPSLVLSLRTVVFNDLKDAIAVAVGYNDANLLALVNLYLSQNPQKQRIATRLKSPP